MSCVVYIFHSRHVDWMKWCRVLRLCACACSIQIQGPSLVAGQESVRVSRCISTMSVCVRSRCSVCHASMHLSQELADGPASRLSMTSTWPVVGVVGQSLKFLFRNDMVRVVNPASTRVWPKQARSDKLRGEYRQYATVTCMSVRACECYDMSWSGCLSAEML